MNIRIVQQCDENGNKIYSPTIAQYVKTKNGKSVEKRLNTLDSSVASSQTEIEEINTKLEHFDADKLDGKHATDFAILDENNHIKSENLADKDIQSIVFGNLSDFIDGHYTTFYIDSVKQISLNTKKIYIDINRNEVYRWSSDMSYFYNIENCIKVGVFNNIDSKFYIDNTFQYKVNLEENKIYIDNETNYIYRYDGKDLIAISSGNGDSDIVSLTKSQYKELCENNQIIIDGETITYDDNTYYAIIDDEEQATTVAFASIDSELSESSENPVQNKIITAKLNECFQSVSDGKNLIASAITDKGINTDATATFEKMANNIKIIKSGMGNFSIRPSNEKTKMTFSKSFYIKNTSSNLLLNTEEYIPEP